MKDDRSGKQEPKVQFTFMGKPITPRQALGAGLSQEAMVGVIEALRLGRYKATEEQLAHVGSFAVHGCLALAHEIADVASVSEDELREMGREFGAKVVFCVLGPPPVAQ